MWKLALLIALIGPWLAACGGQQETAVSRLLSEERQLTEAELDEVLDRVSARLAGTETLRQERVEPNPPSSVTAARRGSTSCDATKGRSSRRSARR